MADAIDQATDTSGRVDAADTSNTEDTLESLENDDLGWNDGDTVEETTEESDTDSAATEEVEESDEESDDDVADEGTDSKEEETEDANDEEQTTDTDNKSAEEAAEQQRRNDEAAQRRIAERQAREQAKQEAANQLLNQSYEQAYDQAVEAGFDDQQARLQAAQALSLQQLQLDAYNNRVMQVTNKVTADLNNAVSQIAEFKSDNPVIREAMLRAVDNFEVMHVQKDANGEPVQVTGDLLTFLQNEAETIRQLTGLGAQQQTEAKQDQKKRTMAPPSRTPKKAKVDPDLAAFDAEAARW